MLSENLKNDLKLAMSIAFSWGSVIVLIFGCDIIQNRGLPDYLLYSFSGSICLSIFGYIYHKHLLHKDSPKNLLIKSAMIGLQIITLLFQMKLIYEYFVPLIGNEFSHILSTSLGLIFVWWMYKRGLISSIITDNWQGGIALISLSLSIIYCFLTNCPTFDVITGKEATWGWGLWSLITLPCAVICDLQHWRRAELDTSKRAYFLATLIYMFLFLLIGLIGIFKVPNEIRLMMIIPVLGLATSTIDSISVALHECYNKKVGSILASLICCFWWTVMGESLFFLWNSMAGFRLFGASLILIYSFYQFRKERNLIPQ